MTSAERSIAVVLLLVVHCLLLPQIFCWGFMFGSCFAMHYLVPFLVLQSSRWGRKSWLLYFNGILMSFDLLFCVSSSWCHGLVCIV